MKQPVNSILQIAYVVEDLRASIDDWRRGMNLGPFFVAEHAKLDNVQYRGQSICPDLSFAIALSGNIQVEFVQQHDDAPSIYKDVARNSRIAFHHLWKRVDDLDRALSEYSADGRPQVCSGSMAGCRFAFVDTVSQVGGFTELVEMSPAIIGLWERMEKASVGWNGLDPIRPFPNFGANA